MCKSWKENIIRAIIILCCDSKHSTNLLLLVHRHVTVTTPTRTAVCRRVLATMALARASVVTQSESSVTNIYKQAINWLIIMQVDYNQSRGTGAGPAGPANAGPMFTQKSRNKRARSWNSNCAELQRHRQLTRVRRLLPAPTVFPGPAKTANSATSDAFFHNF